MKYNITHIRRRFQFVEGFAKSNRCDALVRPPQQSNDVTKQVLFRRVRLKRNVNVKNKIMKSLVEAIGASCD